MEKITCEIGESKTQPSMSVEVNDSVQEPTAEMSNVKDSTEGLADTGVIRCKRKLSEGKDVDIEKISEKDSFPDDPATQENEVKASNEQKNEVGHCVAQEKDVGHDAKMIKFDLNDLPIHEDEAGELDENVRGNEDSPPIPELQEFYQNPQMEEDKYSSNTATYEIAAKEIEADHESPILEKNDVESSSAKIFEFDLNELPADEDEDEA